MSAAPPAAAAWPAALAIPATEAACLAALAALRWPGGMRCAACGAVGHRLGGRWARARFPTYQCSNGACRIQTSLVAGTPLAGTRLPLRTWFAAVDVVARRGMVSVEALADELAVSRKTAWRIRHVLRGVMIGLAPAPAALPAGRVLMVRPRTPRLAELAVDIVRRGGQPAYRMTTLGGQRPESLASYRREGVELVYPLTDRDGAGPALRARLSAHRAARHTGHLLAELCFRSVGTAAQRAARLLAGLVGRPA